MNISTTAQKYGCSEVIQFQEELSPKHINYLDLAERNQQKNRPNIEAVAEFQSRPLLYLVSASSINGFSQEALIELRQMLANRGESAYFGVISPGELVVYPINLDRSILKSSSSRTVKADDPEAIMLFPEMTSGKFSLDGEPKEADFVYHSIYAQLTGSSEALIETYSINPLDVLSFLGRALFFRFLIDRAIIKPNEVPSICPKAQSFSDCFSNVENSIATSEWLDETFNGDLLPLSESTKKIFTHAKTQTNGNLFIHLKAIIEGWTHIGNNTFQPQLPIDWDDLDFAHIPIGVFSQVYETFSHAWDNAVAATTSVFYTPKNIARHLVDEAFAGVKNKSAARILDPSCGAGIFLVMCFRKLVAARWEKDNKRPSTKIIQDILYKQICGFDVSKSAIRLAALSLYITAIELNDSPRPPKKLKFPEPLKDCVLFNHRKKEECDTKIFILGSLRPDISESFNGAFDLVIGNPPWSRLKSDSKDKETKKREQEAIKSHNAVFTGIAKQALIARGLTDIADEYKNPDNNPDLPFIWAATQWAKPNAIIAMALPGRIFLKQTKAGQKAFHSLLNAITITGILNGSNLSDTKVWPDMSEAFMLFYARNNKPSDQHAFHFITPYFDAELNQKGKFRIDYRSAQTVESSLIKKHPPLLKTIAIGTKLDFDVTQKAESLNYLTIEQYWDNNKGCLYSGLGYNRSAEQPQKDAEFMCSLPEFHKDYISDQDPNQFHIDSDRLGICKPNLTTGSPTFHRPRDKQLYNAPLLIVPESPGNSTTSPKSWIFHTPVVFSSSHYGFSANGSNDDICTISLLHLITHSQLFRYLTILSSSKMGVERRAFLKSDLERFPFPDIDTLPAKTKKQIKELSKKLECARIKPFDEINDCIYSLYNMDKYDRQVIDDTLAVSLPYSNERTRGNNLPIGNERSAFYKELQHLLAPSFDITNDNLQISEINIFNANPASPWFFFHIATGQTPALDTKQCKQFIAKIIKQSNEHGCSRVIAHGQSSLVVGIFGQYRYWTKTRARLCALNILRNHLDVFPMEKS